MNLLARFYQRGIEDADRRVAAALGPVPTAAADRYLRTSRVVMALDLATLRLRDWRLASASGRWLSTAYGSITRVPVMRRARTLAIALLTAVVVHLTLMLMQGTRPGWFWLLIPAMVAAFAALTLAGSRASGPAE